MNKSVIKHIGVGILFVLSQLLIFQYLTIYGAIADVVLIFLLWLSLHYKRHELLFFAAGLGLFQDMLFDTWGLNMFAKTITLFVLYRFTENFSETRLLFWQVLVLTLAAAITHNIFYFIFASFLDAFGFSYSPIIILTVSSFYTAVVGTLLFILKGDPKK